MPNRQIERRAFIASLGGAAAWPMLSRAQQASGMRRIGMLTTFAESDRLAVGWDAAFRKGLDALGWHDGRNVEIVSRWAAGDSDRLQAFAMELVGQQPDVTPRPRRASRRFCTKRARSRLSSLRSPIRSAAALLVRSHDRAATSAGSPTSTSKRPSGANGWN
jgi:hypothetical protein